jgi:pimeloyl-ACP methyl ester carboxylesterase
MGRTRGITGLVYTSIRGVTHLVGGSLNLLLTQITPRLDEPLTTPQREAALATLNGVVGDYLAATANPLAITMHLRQDGQPLRLDRQALSEAISAGAGPAAGRIVVLVHGLCMNDLQWQRQGHDHGAALARDLGYTPLYLHYNSGLHISSNGAAFAALLEDLLANWPVAVEELIIVAHSMGGLVTRSACQVAAQTRQDWSGYLAHRSSAAAIGLSGCWAPILTAPHSLAWAKCAAPASPICITAACATAIGRGVTVSATNAPRPNRCRCLKESPATPLRLSKAKTPSPMMFWRTTGWCRSPAPSANTPTQTMT